MLFPFINLPLSQVADGFTVQYKRVASEVRYQFRGQMLTVYAGAIDAPPSRAVDMAGTLILRTEQRPGNRWVVVAVTDGIKVTRAGKPVPKEESHLALKGTWTQTVGGSATYTAKGLAVLPVAFNAPLWPMAWAPIAADKGMKVGEVWSSIFSLPAQAFLEDDPIGWFGIPLNFVFNGQDPINKNLYSISLKTSHDFNDPVKHPEAKDLFLTGNVLLDGRIKTRKDDGRLESANVIFSFDIGLTSDAYEFGFSKARGSVTAVLDRIE